jgi:hypothetical protein
MAQVVQQRTPPYLLIVFGFISLVAIVVAVLFYMQADETQARVERLEEDIKILATSKQRSGDLAQQAQRSNKTVVEILEDRVSRLAAMIDPAGGSATYASAVGAFQAFRKSYPGESESLIPMIARLKTDMQRIEQRKQEDLSELNEEITVLQTQLGKARNELETKQQRIDSLETRVNEVNDQIAQREQTLQAQKREIETAYQKLLAERDSRIAQLTQKNQTIDMEMRTLRARNDRLQDDLKAKKREYVQLRQKYEKALAGIVDEPRTVATTPEGAEPANVDLAPKPDGKILRVIEDENLCYINIGAKSDVRPYMPFSVYDAEKGIPSSGSNKGTLLVTKVSPRVSECRIVSYDPENPITIEDIVANIAYDSGLGFDFYVYGRFDLTGKGRPTEQGRDEVKGIIRQSGGTVTEELTVDTDFMVIGPRPTPPAQPREGADLQEISIYEDRLAKLREYDETLAAAIKLGVQILNTDRFIAFTGYSPKMTKR